MSINYTLPQRVSIRHTLDISYGERYYGTINGGDIYFSKRLRSEDWDMSPKESKQKALFEATFMIDRLNFKGSKTSLLQVLQFPRDRATSVPKDIENAAYEIAILLLGGLDPEQESRNLETQTHRFGTMTTEQNVFRSPQPYVLAGIYSAKAWRFLYPYLRDSSVVNLVRVD